MRFGMKKNEVIFHWLGELNKVPKMRYSYIKHYKIKACLIPNMTYMTHETGK